jgi:hypothetical protein
MRLKALEFRYYSYTFLALIGMASFLRNEKRYNVKQEIASKKNNPELYNPLLLKYFLNCCFCS